jgi:hypothetical protein
MPDGFGLARRPFVLRALPPPRRKSGMVVSRGPPGLQPDKPVDGCIAQRNIGFLPPAIPIHRNQSFTAGVIPCISRARPSLF